MWEGVLSSDLGNILVLWNSAFIVYTINGQMSINLQTDQIIFN